MINYGKDGVVSVAVRKLCDQVHGYDLKWLGRRRDVDFVWWGSDPMCERFVLLTFGASFDVVFDPFGHCWPPGDSFGGVDGPVLSYVCCCGFVVYQV